jgi:hypothetical protein
MLLENTWIYPEVFTTYWTRDTSTLLRPVWSRIKYNKMDEVFGPR